MGTNVRNAPQRRRRRLRGDPDAPVEQHGQHVRVRGGVTRLRRRQRPPFPVRALLRLVHVTPEARRDDAGETDARAEHFFFRERDERERFDVHDADAARVLGILRGRGIDGGDGFQRRVRRPQPLQVVV
eukprot:14257-Pelagococcus_subviridis.AAC.2